MRRLPKRGGRGEYVRPKTTNERCAKLGLPSLRGTERICRRQGEGEGGGGGPEQENGSAEGGWGGGERERGERDGSPLTPPTEKMQSGVKG